MAKGKSQMANKDPRQRLSPALICYLPLAICHFASAPANAQEKGVPRVLLDRALEERPVLLTALDAGTLTYMDGALVRTEPTAEYFAILPAPPAPAAPRSADRFAAAAPEAPAGEPRPGMLLELIDGQALTGTLAGAAPGGDGFAWSHPSLGPVRLKIDHLRRLRVAPSAAPAEAPAASDLIVFVNGDRMEAFVENLADPITVSVGEETHTIPLERIAQVVFANPPQAPSGAFAWLADGSVLGVRHIRTTRVGEVLLTPRLASDSESPEMAGSGGAASIPLADLTGLNFDIAALRPLSALEPESQEPAGARRWAPPLEALGRPGALGAQDLLLPGPMSVRWSLPDDMTRLVADAELPRESWTWGDLELVVAVSGAGAPRELVRQRLHAAAPSVRINADLGEGGGRTLEVRIEAGSYGPVQDRVVLRRPLLAAAASAD